MEKDDEVKGKGNSYDFGARLLDTRLGRWLTIDPFFKQYSHLSNYSFVANSPLIFLDPDGRIIEFANRKSRKQYEKLYKAADQATKAKLDNLKSSQVVVYVNANNSNMGKPAVGKQIAAGETTYNFSEKRVEININKNVSDRRQVGALGDELESANLFVSGKIGFAQKTDGTVVPLGNDREDEIASQRAAISAQESLNLGLDDSQSAFKKADSEDKLNDWFTDDPVGKTYSKLTQGSSTSSNFFASPGESVTLEDLQKSIQDKIVSKIVFIRDEVVPIPDKPLLLQTVTNRVDIGLKKDEKTGTETVETEKTKIK